jgi:uncharacterized membrane protein YciS (DUF1049 family)
LLRRIVAAIILVPLAFVIIAFAVANRHDVVISFDPFDAAQPVYSMTTWLFAPIFAALILGVIIGGVASWLGQGKWRGAARRFERELQVLRGKLSAYEGAADSQNNARRASEPAARLRLRPPV